MVATYQDPAERGYLRLFYRDWHPTRLGKLVTGTLAWISGMGLTPQVLLTLQVRGRRSGRLHDTVLVVAKHAGQRYLVSMLGDGSEWVRNVRAAGGKAFVKRGQSRPVQLTEVPLGNEVQSSRVTAKSPRVAANIFPCRTMRRSRSSMPWPSATPCSASTRLSRPHRTISILTHWGNASSKSYPRLPGEHP
jgi:F420H(2)-dependent quinone reductase